jgi:hypothetical protein
MLLPCCSLTLMHFFSLFPSLTPLYSTSQPSIMFSVSDSGFLWDPGGLNLRIFLLQPLKCCDISVSY